MVTYLGSGILEPDQAEDRPGLVGNMQAEGPTDEVLVGNIEALGNVAGSPDSAFEMAADGVISRCRVLAADRDWGGRWPELVEQDG